MNPYTPVRAILYCLLPGPEAFMRQIPVALPCLRVQHFRQTLEGALLDPYLHAASGAQWARSH